MKHAMHYVMSALALPAMLSAGFDKGGVTFPMEKISAARLESPAESGGQNLLKNSDLSAPLVDWKQPDGGWHSGIWIAGPGNMDKYYKSVKDIVSAKIIDMDGAKALELLRPAELEKVMGKEVPRFTMAFNQTVKLPDENGGLYCLSFDNRNQRIGDAPYAQMVLFDCNDGSAPGSLKGKKIKSFNIKVDDSPEWHLFRKEFNVPPGTRVVSISIRADGCGKLQLKNPKLVKLNAPALPITIQLSPGKLLDNTFALAAGDPGVIAFKFRHNQPKGTLADGRITMNLELPSEISVNGTNPYFGREIVGKDISVDGKSWKRWTFELSPYIIASIRNTQEFNEWHLSCAMISGQAPAGMVWNNCRYYLTENGKAVSNTGIFSLKMMPSFSKITAPERFYSGFSSAAADIQFQQPEAESRFAEFAGKSGSTLVTAGIHPGYSKKLRKNGIRLVTSESYAIANGYRIGIMDEKKKPEYSKFLDKSGKPFRDGGTPLATCPMAIYNRTPYYKDEIIPLLKSSLTGLDGLQPNWEPFMYRAAGCFCGNCREEFAKFVKLSPEKAKEIWPSQLLPGYPYYDQSIRFRAYQHGRIIKTLHEDCLALGATEIGFCPEVGFNQIIRYPNHFYEEGEFSPYEYADSLKWLNVWGPYNPVHANQFVYKKGANLRTWEIAKRVIRDYRSHFIDPAKRAKLMAMPQGLQGEWLAQPEGMAMDQISSFLAGYDASIFYFFPRGYDHRFWKALADSNALIAANEKMVMGGQKRVGVTVTPETPFPEAVENIDPKNLPDIKESKLLQAAAFEKGGKILVAAGNFWEKGDVVFKLAISGLEAGKEYSVQEKAFGRSFVMADGKAFTGKALAEGILLHAGALRWAFFEINPDGKNTGKAVTATEMQKELERRKMANQAADAEAARDQAFRAENSVGEIKTLEAGTLSCKPVQQDGRPMLKVVSGKNTLLLDPRGMALESWIVGGTELAQPGYGKSAFWRPGKNGMVVNYNYRFTGQEISASGLNISAEFMTSTRNYPELAGLKIVKAMKISADLKQITFEVKLINTLPIAMNDVGYRWSFIPAAWSNQSQGSIKCGKQSFVRPNAQLLLAAACDPATEQTVRRLFMVKEPTVKIENNRFDFAMPGKATTEGVFLPAKQFAGVAVWNTPDMIAATFEPFYQPVMIAPNGNVSFYAEFKIK